jgi:transcriptional regulator with XRE-family HTH domain
VVLSPSAGNDAAMPRQSPSHAHAPVLVAFGRAVQARRSSLDLSQEELADRAEVDRSYMSSIERGVQNVGLVIAAQLARALDTTLADLFTEAQL